MTRRPTSPLCYLLDMPRAQIRLVLACLVFSTWLVLLLAGVALGGAVHLLLAATLLLFPWSRVRR